jgi:hypothetical protein
MCKVFDDGMLRTLLMDFIAVDIADDERAFKGFVLLVITGIWSHVSWALKSTEVLTM